MRFQYLGVLVAGMIHAGCGVVMPPEPGECDITIAYVDEFRFSGSINFFFQVDSWLVFVNESYQSISLTDMEIVESANAVLNLGMKSICDTHQLPPQGAAACILTFSGNVTEYTTATIDLELKLGIRTAMLSMDIIKEPDTGSSIVYMSRAMSCFE
jgi:hypothetical protein